MLRQLVSHSLRSVRPSLAAMRTPLRSLSTSPAEDVDIDTVAYGFMASQALFTGLETGIFDAIDKAGEGGMTLAKLQEATSIRAPRLQTLVTSLVAIKCLL